MDVRNAQEARAFATNVREDYAGELYDLHGVALRIRRAARLGHLSVQIHQDRPIDLRKTGAAAYLIETLLMAGYEAEWVEVRKHEHGQRGDPPREFIYEELLVQWHVRLHAGDQDKT